MSNEATIQFTGNLGGEPELRFTPSGAAVVNFSVGVQARRKTDEGWVDGDTTWYRCNAWRQFAENIAESLTKGDRVNVTGRLKSRSYEAKDGSKGVSWEVEVETCGPDLKFATARSQRPQRGQQDGGWDQGQQGGQQRRQQSNQGGQYGGQQQGFDQGDPWGSAPASTGRSQQGWNEEPPF